MEGISIWVPWWNRWMEGRGEWMVNLAMSDLDQTQSEVGRMAGDAGNPGDRAADGRLSVERGM